MNYDVTKLHHISFVKLKFFFQIDKKTSSVLNLYFRIQTPDIHCSCTNNKKIQLNKQHIFLIEGGYEKMGSV